MGGVSTYCSLCRDRNDKTVDCRRGLLENLANHDALHNMGTEDYEFWKRSQTFGVVGVVPFCIFLKFEFATRRRIRPPIRFVPDTLTQSILIHDEVVFYPNACRDHP
jgi:hypothetical protein